MYNKSKQMTLFAVAVMAVSAFACVLFVADESSAEYGAPTNIQIAPGMRYTYKPTYPADLTVSTVIELQKSGSLTGPNVNIGAMSSGTLIVNIPSSAAAGTIYHVVLKATSENPSQTAYIYITFTVVSNLSVSGSHANIVAGGQVDLTPSAVGLGAKTWSVTTGKALPSGLSLDASTGRVTGSISDPGTYTLYLTCTTSYGESKDLAVTFSAASPLAPTNSPSTGVLIYEI